jgi:hypothetical protein
MEITGSRDQDGVGMVYVRCNDGTIWLDINVASISAAASTPWRKLPAIPEPTVEELEEAEKRRQAAIDAAMEEGKRMDEALQANRERLAEERLGKAVETDLLADRLLNGQQELLAKQEKKERHAMATCPWCRRP